MKIDTEGLLFDCSFGSSLMVFPSNYNVEKLQIKDERLHTTHIYVNINSEI